MITAKCIKENDPWGNVPIGLTKGEEYEVNEIQMGGSYTRITLKGQREEFNSICFKFYEDGKPLDIYKDKRFNPYLQAVAVNHYSVSLALLTNPKRTKHQSEWATSAIEASVKAQKKNPGYVCIEATLIEK